MPLIPSTDPSSPGLAAPICWKCDYSLVGLPPASRCPECNFQPSAHELILRGPAVDLDVINSGTLPPARYILTTPERVDRRLHLFPTGYATRTTFARKSDRWELGDHITIVSHGTLVSVTLELARPLSQPSVLFVGTEAYAREIHALAEAVLANTPATVRRPHLNLRIPPY